MKQLRDKNKLESQMDFIRVKGKEFDRHAFE